MGTNQEETDMSSEFDQLVAEFEKFQSRIQHVDDRFGGLDGMREELGGLQVVATSPDRAVTVVAGPGGAVLDVTFTEEALRRSPAALSATLMTALGEAVAAAARRQAAIVEEHMGDDLHLVDQVLETQATAFGTTVEELRAKLAEEIPALPPDDFSEQSVLRRADDTPAPPAASGGDAFLRKLFDEEA